MAFLPRVESSSSSSSRTEEDKYESTLPSNRVKELVIAFAKYETFPGSQEINAKKLISVLRSLGRNPNLAEAREMTNVLDPGSGRIKFIPFLKAMESKMKEDRLDEELKDAFQVFDKDGSGTVPLNEMCAVLRVAVEGITEQEISEMVNFMDQNNDGELDYKEFVATMNLQ